MAMCDKLLEGASSEWALLRRHESEGEFGIQIAANKEQSMGRVRFSLCLLAIAISPYLFAQTRIAK
jgi:hypothetical protein